jgi:hypothetical protein
MVEVSRQGARQTTIVCIYFTARRAAFANKKIGQKNSHRPLHGEGGGNCGEREWFVDFASDALFDGRRFQPLPIMDNDTL